MLSHIDIAYMLFNLVVLFFPVGVVGLVCFGVVGLVFYSLFALLFFVMLIGFKSLL